MNEQSPSPTVSTKSNIYFKNQQAVKTSNECSSSPQSTNSDSSSDTNNETITLTNANSSFANRYSRPTGRRFFTGKSKSAAVSRSGSNSRLMAAEKIYISQNSSEEDQLSTSETDDLNSDEYDEDSKLVYKTCLESQLPTQGIYLKKTMSRPECALKNFQFNSTDSKVDSNRRFIKNKNRLRPSKSLSNYKNTEYQSNEEDAEQENSYYRQLDGHMKMGKLSRFKVIKCKSNSALQPVRNNCKCF